MSSVADVQRGRANRALGLAARSGLFLVGCAYVYYRVDLAEAAQMLAGVSLPWVFVSLGLFCLALLCTGFRLRVISGGAVPALAGANATVVCAATNAVMPGRVGDLAKVGCLKAYGVPLGTALYYITLDRLADLAFTLTALGLTFGGHTPLGPWGWAAACLGAWSGVALLVCRPQWLAPLLRLVPLRALRERLQTILDGVLQARRGGLGGLVLATIPTWLLYYGALYVTIRFACGLALPPVEAFGALACGTLSLFVPAAPAGLGVYEAALVWSLGRLGVESGPALVAALAAHAVQIAPLFPWAAALALLGRGGMRGASPTE